MKVKHKKVLDLFSNTFANEMWQFMQDPRNQGPNFSTAAAKDSIIKIAKATAFSCFPDKEWQPAYEDYVGTRISSIIDKKCKKPRIHLIKKWLSGLFRK